MFTRTVTALTLAGFVAALSGPAFANPGTDQMALQLGVQPGAYTQAQLIELENAYRDNDSTLVAFILSQGNGVVSRGDSMATGIVTPGEAELARSLGVAPGAYSLSDLTRLQGAVQDDDKQAIAFIIGGGSNNGAGSDTGVVNAGKAETARALGLDPAAYTTQELVARYLDSIS